MFDDFNFSGAISAKETSPKAAFKLTYKPSLHTFEDSVLENLNLDDEESRKTYGKSYWY